MESIPPGIPERAGLNEPIRGERKRTRSAAAGRPSPRPVETRPDEAERGCREMPARAVRGSADEPAGRYGDDRPDGSRRAQGSPEPIGSTRPEDLAPSGGPPGRRRPPSWAEQPGTDGESAVPASRGERGGPAGASRAERVGPGSRVGVPLIVTEDEELLDDLLRLCAAAGAEPEVSFGPPSQPGSWEAAALVLVGDDCASGLRRAARRAGVLLIGRDLDDHDVWRRAVDIGADHVLFLPDAESWLVDRIADAAEGIGDAALTIGVVGGRGGAGASTLACALAVTSAREGRRTMLVDGDPLGGGLDVLLGGERAAGLRWPDLAESQGRVSGGALEDSLPRLHDLSVLSWDRTDSVVITPEAMRSVLGAARRRGGVVVVDLPRRVDDAVIEALAQIDVGLLVVPAELRAVAAADRVASRMGMLLRDLRVVARGPFTSGLGDAEIARLLGLPLAGELPSEKGLLEAIDAGRPPGAHARGPLARFCAAFLDEASRSGGGVAA